MTKDESLKILAEANVDTTLTESGEIRASLLEFAAKGVKAAADAEAHQKVVETLNATIEDLEKKKTPVERADLVTHKKSKKAYRLAQPKSNFKGKQITAEILNGDQGLLEELLKTKTPLLVEQKED